ncbi:putative serine carboxypeptidase-like protein 23 [Tanacetum coccineum]
MGRKHNVFLATLELLLLLLVTITTCKCQPHGLRANQAETLMSFRRSKNRAQANTNIESLINEGGLNDMKTDNNGRKMEDDFMKEGLPGQPLTKGLMFKQYAGYINVDSFKGRSLFYYFVEALDEPSTKPLVLWLNGGPGCSSLGVGAMLEIGPFGVNPDGKTLYSRRFSWNKVANVLFLESPAGVGFSYSNTSSDYNLSGDKRTAEDSYVFLVNWFQRFPHYKKHEFYIIGESYAGFYIPELADVITKKNVKAHSSSIINLKGIMIGNGVMNDDTDDKGFTDYLWSHALISDELYKNIAQHCGYANNSDYCTNLEDEVGEEIGDIDFYNIYGPTCNPLPEGLTVRKRRNRRSGGMDPCEGEYVENYLNLPQVQKAFHANVTKLSHRWETCSKLIVHWKDSPTTMFPIYKRLIALGLRILLYSGDVDAVVPVSGTRYSIDAMNLKVVKPWRFWTDATKQVAGYRVVYDGLTFATVRGAGHEVPRFQPHQAFALLKMFLANRE